MKILITTYWYKPAINGVVTSVINLEQRLKEKGHDVRVLTLSTDPYSKVECGNYFSAAFKLGAVYPHARIPISRERAFFEDILAWKPDIVHSQCEFFTFSFARKVADTLGIPLVHTYHTIYEDYTHYFSPSKMLGKRAAASFTRYVLEKVDSVVVPTAKVERLLKGYRVRNKVYTVPSGIDLSQFDIKLSEEERINIRESYGITGDKPLAMTIGRLAKEKNIDEIIENIAGEDVCLMIVGDGPYRQELEAQAKQKCEPGQAVFTGLIEPEEVPKLYAASDVFVSASSSETQGLTYFEALASGLPCVCRKDPCIEGVIIDEENGYQYSSERGFKRAIRSLIYDKDKMAAFAENAIKSVEQYSAECFADSIEQVYFETLANERIKYGAS